MKSFPQGDISARDQGFEVIDFPLLGEQNRAIEPHLLVCQSYRWQIGPTMWSSPTTKSFDPIVVTTLWLDVPVKASVEPYVDLPEIDRCQKRGQWRRREKSAYKCSLINRLSLIFIDAFLLINVSRCYDINM